MKRTEWIGLFGLMLLTMFTLAVAPPRSRPANPEIAAVLGTPTPTMSATATPTASPTQTPLPTSTPTVTRTLTPVPSATSTPKTPTMTPPPPTATPWPFDTHSDLARFIFVDQGTQHMYVFSHGQLERLVPCSTGLPDGDKYTPAWTGEVGQYWGTFFAFDVYADEAWYLYKSDGSILVHSLPYVWENGYKVYLDRDALGVRPASHGCIRISPEDAEWLTQWNPEGVLMAVSDPYREKWR